MKTLLTMAVLCTGTWALAQLPPGDGPNPVATTALEPTPVKFEESLLARLQVPAGFKVTVFAKDLQHARWMELSPQGDVYLSRPKQGDVLLLRDTNKVGVADSRKVVAQNVKNVHGLVRRGQQLFMATDKKVLGGDLKNGDGLLLTAPTELYVVRNADNEIARLRLDPSWTTAKIERRLTDPRLHYPTTAAAVPAGLLVVNSQLDKQKSPPPLLPFDVVTVAPRQ
jgi:hypothetical protein